MSGPIRAGDEEAKEILIENNLGLVRSVVSKFLNIGYDRDDLFQLGSSTSNSLANSSILGSLPSFLLKISLVVFAFIAICFRDLDTFTKFLE